MEFRYKNPKLLFHGKRVDVLSVDASHPKGGTIQREVVSHPGAVVILPILDDETVVLIKNERYVVQETLWELPAGTLEKNEDPKACAKRELLEETGYFSNQIEPLLEFFSTPGFCNEKLHVYVAKNLSYKKQELDDTEKIDVETIKWQKVMEMIRASTIRDNKTISALLFYYTFFLNKNSES